MRFFVLLYLAHSTSSQKQQPDSDVLHARLKRLDVDELVVALVESQGPFNFSTNFMSNWVCSLKAVGVQNYLVVAADEPAHAAAIGHGFNVVPLSDVLPNVSSLGAASWIDYCRLKPMVARQFLRAGVDVLWSDLDVVFLREPFVALRELTDIHHQKILFSVERPTAVPNTGLYWAPSNIEVLAGFDTWIDNIEANPAIGRLHDKNHDQALLSTSMFRHAAMLPWEWFENGFRIKREQSSYTPSPDQVTLHINMMWGVEAKRQHLRAAGLWFLEGDGACPFESRPTAE